MVASVSVFILYTLKGDVYYPLAESRRYIVLHIKFHRAPTSVFRQQYFSSSRITFSRVICETSGGVGSCLTCISYELCGTKEFLDVNW